MIISVSVGTVAKSAIVLNGSFMFGHSIL